MHACDDVLLSENRARHHCDAYCDDSHSILPKRPQHEQWMVDMAFSDHAGLCCYSRYTQGVAFFRVSPAFAATFSAHGNKTTIVRCFLTSVGLRRPLCVLLDNIFHQRTGVGARIARVAPILVPVVSTILLRSSAQMPPVVTPPRRRGKISHAGRGLASGRPRRVTRTPGAYRQNFPSRCAPW